MFGKNFTVIQCQKIENIIKAVSKDTESFSEDNIDYIVAQASPILYGDDFKFDFKNDDEKISFKIKVISDVGKVLNEYKKFKNKKNNRDKIFIMYKNKYYTSNFINIKTYFYINDNFNSLNINELIENVLYMIYEDILPIEVFDEIKTEDPLYYEIILDDVSSLIFKTLKEMSTIKNIERPDYLKKNTYENVIKIEYSNEENVYATMMENYNLTPFEVNKNKAYDILKSISIISNKHVINDFDEYVSQISDIEFRKALIYQFKKEGGVL